MPMSPAFERKLQRILPDLIEEFGTPFHLYDEKGIIQTGNRLKKAFNGVQGFREYYAVKANPNPAILTVMQNLGFGYDCSSIPEFVLAHRAGAIANDIMFTGNDSTPTEFAAAMRLGAIINFDDVSLMDSCLPFPKLACFRINPGKSRTGNTIIGKPAEAKYGITLDQILPAYAEARERGAEEFGIHTMVCSNQRDYRYVVETVRSLLRHAAMLYKKLGIKVKFVNIGGGIGIPYEPEHKEFDIEALGAACRELTREFKDCFDFVPDLYMESGRYITGPHGVLVTKVINRKEIYQTHVGTDSGMFDMMRHAIYGVYHEISAYDAQGRSLKGPHEIVNVVGPVCENCDRFATQRSLPRTKIGNVLFVQDTGAHGRAMGNNYNGRGRCQELNWAPDGTVFRSRRAETMRDLFATLKHPPKVWTPSKQ